MIALLAGMAAAVGAGGIFAMVVGWRHVGHQPPKPEIQGESAHGLLDRLGQWWHHLKPHKRRLVVAGLVAGVVVLAITHWVPALVIVPIVVIAGPGLLGDPKNRDVEVLEALDRWVRALTASLLTGKSIPDAIRSTRQQAPSAIFEAVGLAAARLDERWSLPDAMAGLSDDIDHADGDAVAAALVVAGQRGTAAATTLGALADSLQDRLAAARDMDNERAKPRIVVRQVTAITGVVLALALVTSPAYFAPYRDGLGPWLATGLALVYIGALAKLQTASRPPARARIRLIGGRP